MYHYSLLSGDTFSIALPQRQTQFAYNISLYKTGRQIADPTMRAAKTSVVNYVEYPHAH